MVIHWLARCSIRRWPVTGVPPTTGEAMEICLEVLRSQCRQDRRHQDLAALRPRRRSSCAAACRLACACIRAMTSTIGADRGRRGGLLARPARHLRCHRTRRQRRLHCACGRGQGSALRSDPGAHGPALAAHLPGSDPLLQDGRGLHGLAQRPPAPFQHAGRAGERPLDPALRRAVPARRQGGLLRDPELATSRMRHLLACTGSTDARCLRSTGSRSTSPRSQALGSASGGCRLRCRWHPRRGALARSGGGHRLAEARAFSRGTGCG